MRFKFRDVENILIALGGFALLFLVLSLLTGGFLAMLISMAIMLAIFFAFLNNRPIGFNCPHAKCGKYIESNHPWICGFKQCRNDNADAYPFVHRCQHCGAEPKAYQCHHCDELVFFTRDELKKNFARCTRASSERDDLNIPDLEKNSRKAELEEDIVRRNRRLGWLKRKPAPYDDDQGKRENTVAELDHQILLNKKQAELAGEQLKAKLAAEANLPLAERAEKKRARKLERFDIADKGRALAKERYGEGSLNYKREKAFWDEFEEERSIGD